MPNNEWNLLELKNLIQLAMGIDECAIAGCRMGTLAADIKKESYVQA